MGLGLEDMLGSVDHQVGAWKEGREAGLSVGEDQGPGGLSEEAETKDFMRSQGA